MTIYSQLDKPWKQMYCDMLLFNKMFGYEPKVESRILNEVIFQDVKVIEIRNMMYYATFHLQPKHEMVRI